MPRDLRRFIALLESRGQLRRISAEVDPDLEIAEIADRLLACGGPALLFERVKGSRMPLLINTLGTVERICWALGMEQPQDLEELGKKLALLYQPRPPRSFAQAVELGQALLSVFKARPSRDLIPPCQQVVRRGEEVDLTQLPLLRVYPGDAGRVLTLGLMVTKDPENGIPSPSW